MNCGTFCVKFGQQALVGEGSSEEQLFFSESGSLRDGVSSELDGYIQKLKVLFFCSCTLSLYPPKTKLKERKQKKKKKDKEYNFLSQCLLTHVYWFMQTTVSMLISLIPHQECGLIKVILFGSPG